MDNKQSKKTGTGKEELVQDGKVVRRKVSFPSHGLQINGWLYRPAHLLKEKNPAIILANALTAVKEITLPGYAERFALRVSSVLYSTTAFGERAKVNHVTM